MRAAVQVLKKTEDLKQQTAGDFLNDNDAWNRHRKLQELYQQLLVVDLEYALDKKVEQDLWNHVFKNHITRLQSQAKDRKNPQRTECQENLAWFLEAASGFYLQLLQELCEAFDLDVPCRRKGSVYGQTKEIKPLRSDITLPQKSSSLYICQHCLVHMGDIARYRSQSLQAESFYRHAADLIPSNGQPYNQLAILEAAKGDKLSTVFYYVRSIAVKHPFPVAMTNLQKMYSKIVNDEFVFENKTKLSVYDYISAFLQFHTLIHLTSDLNKARQLGKTLATNLTILIATESLSAWKLIQMMAINLFAVEHATHSLLIDSNTSVTENRGTDTPLSEDEQTACNLVLELLASTLNGILLLVYTMKEEAELRSYYALPVLKTTFEWLRQNPSHLKAASFTSKFQIWPSFCKLVNSIQTSQRPEFDGNKYACVPLPEDWDLQSFLPLQKAHRSYKFHESFQPSFTLEDELGLRTHRLVLLGQWLCEQEIYGVKLMSVQPAKEGGGRLTFEAITPQAPSTDVLKLLEEMTIGLCTVPTAGDGDDTGLIPITAGHNHKENGFNVDDRKTNGKSPCPAPAGVVGDRFASNGQSPSGEEHGGDSSYKTSTIANDATVNRTVLTNARRTRQNVALQTIMQKKSLIEDSLRPMKPEGKMVTFKTPSPSPPASSGGGTPPLAAPPTGEQQQQQQPMHAAQHVQSVVYAPVQSMRQFKSALPFSSSAYGNSMDSNSRNALASEPVYPVNQASNSNLDFYGGNNEILSSNYPSHMYGGGGQSHQGPVRSPPIREQMNGSNQVTNHPPPSAAAAQHHALMLGGYNHNNLPMNRRQAPPPSLPLMAPPPPTGPLLGLPCPPPPPPQNRLPLNHHSAGVVAAALANQKQQASFALNATLFGPGSHVPQPPPPPWFHQAPNMDRQQFMAQISAGSAATRPTHMLLPQPQQQQPVTSGPALHQQMPYPYGAVSRMQQQFSQPPDGNQFVYQMMGKMSDPFSIYPAPPPPPPPSAATVESGAANVEHLLHSSRLHHSVAGSGGIIGGQSATAFDEQQQAVTQHSPGRRSNVPPVHEGGQQRKPADQERAAADELKSDVNMSSTYSLFNSPWSSGLNVTSGTGLATTSAASGKHNNTGCSPTISATSNGDELEGFLVRPGLQSLWSGPGPSPLERLLEQQKLKKDTVPH